MYLFFQLDSNMIPSERSIFASPKWRLACVPMMNSLFLGTNRRLDHSKPVQTIIGLNKSDYPFNRLPRPTYTAIDSFWCKNNSTGNMLKMIRRVSNSSVIAMIYQNKD